MSHITITKENFEKEVVNNSKPVLIDFWAGWCGPCKMLSPILDQIASEQDDVIIAKVNVDEQPELSTTFGIMSIPTLIFFNKGAVVGKEIGLQSKEKILKLISIQE